MGEPLLEVDGLSVTFATRKGPVRIVDAASFRVDPARATGLVGESGSGKTVTALSIMRLHEQAHYDGVIRFEGEDLLRLPERQMRALRGGRIAFVFQDPMAALNPAFRIGSQIAEAVRLHGGRGRRRIEERVVELLGQVGIPDPAQRALAYPHELSGGMRQRVVLAMALACEPSLLIADEPTSALDSTIQAQILELLSRLRRERQLGLLLITHDLGVVADCCDDVVVMYAGQVVESGPVDEVLTSPRHPYTAGLLASAPVPGGPRGRLKEIPGVVPDLMALPPGCRFAPRCAAARQLCEAEPPSLSVDGGRTCRCSLQGAAGGGAR